MVCIDTSANCGPTDGQILHLSNGVINQRSRVFQLSSPTVKNLIHPDRHRVHKVGTSSFTYTLQHLGF